MSISFGQSTELPSKDGLLIDKDTVYTQAKRALDIVLAMAAIIALSPLLLMVALLIKLADFGPIFFVHTRIGRDGIPFNCIKFRSMHVKADQLKEQLTSQSQHSDQRSFKIVHDPRVTWIGRYLRKFSIDELPQLWNVVLGDMSLVGPRPPCPQEVARYSRRDWQRLSVRPGLTCFWQVSGRGDIPFDRQVEMDLEYVQKRSFWLDMKLILWTIPAVLSARGAY